MFARAGITPQTSYISRIIPSPWLSGKQAGAAAGAAGAGALLLTIPTPPTAIVGGTLLAAGAFAGSSLTKNDPTVFTDNTDPTQIRQALIKRITAAAPLTLFGAELKGQSPFSSSVVTPKGDK